MSALFDVAPSYAPGRIEVPDQASDSWFTPLPLWQRLHAKYRYGVDLFGHLDAPVTKAIGFACIPPLLDAFTLPPEKLEGLNVWCNPPYSSPTHGRAIELAWRLLAHHSLGPALITCLLHGGKTEQPAWQQYVEPYRDNGPHTAPGGRWQWTCSTRHLAKRQTFGHPADPTGAQSESAKFPSVLVHFARWEVGKWSGGDKLRSLNLGG